MKWIIICIFAVIFCHVLAAPSSRIVGEEDDSVEQELIRNHHSAAIQRLKSEINKASSVTDESTPVESIKEIDETEDDPDGSFTDDDLYDITVGDVIRDVLLTLRDHPEIVKQLIASEKAKLAEQIDAFNSLVDKDSTGDNLAGYMVPAEQLKSVPKRVEKKDGRSILSGQTTGDKRADEVINDEYARVMDADESKQYNDFLDHPLEGGKDDPMFDYEKSYSEMLSSSTDLEDMSSASQGIDDGNRESTENKEYHTSSSDQEKDNEDTVSSSLQSVSSDSQADDSQDLNSEEQLAWLLHKSHLRSSGDTTRQDIGDNGQRHSPM